MNPLLLNSSKMSSGIRSLRGLLSSSILNDVFILTSDIDLPVIENRNSIPKVK
jgi:hypothetical protein